MAIVMARDPVPMFPVWLNPLPMMIVVAFDPDLSTPWVGAHGTGTEDGQKGQADTKNKQFHFHFQFLFLSDRLWLEQFF